MERLLQSVNKLLLEQLADNPVLLLREMGYKCTTRPYKLMLADFETRPVGVEMMKRKRKLNEALGFKGGMKSQVPLNRRAQDARGGRNVGATSRRADYASGGRTWSGEHGATRDTGAETWNLLEDGRDAVLCGFTNSYADA